MCMNDIPPLEARYVQGKLQPKAMASMPASQLPYGQAHDAASVLVHTLHPLGEDHLETCGNIEFHAIAPKMSGCIDRSSTLPGSNNDT